MTSAGKAFAAVLVVLLHASLLISCVAIKPPPLAGDGAKPKPDDIHELHEVVQSSSIVLLPNNGTNALTGESCKDKSYVGIGIATSWSDAILKVGEQTPAQRAGLLPLDQIIGGDPLKVDGYPEGTILHLIVQRGGVILPVRVVVGRICNDRAGLEP